MLEQRIVTLRFPVISLEKTGKNIERLRKERGISVKELQEFFGFERPQAIYKWQWGECLPTVDNLYALSRVLNVPMQEILVEEGRDLLVFGEEGHKAPGTFFYWFYETRMKLSRFPAAARKSIAV